MFDTERLDRAGLGTATLDEVLCIARQPIAGSDPAAPDRVNERPSICLNMIVRNEAHIIHEALDSVAPHITSWVIVDTGSDDGTQDLIREHMARLGVPGKLYERPWRNFAENRTEALTLAQGQGDYIWILDADDTLAGTPDFTRLDADIYLLRYHLGSDVYWRPQLFRTGLRMRYEGVVHEYAAWDDPYTCVQLEGDYHIAARTVGARSQDPLKYAHDRDLLAAEVESDPKDARSVFYLAQSCFDLGRTRRHLYDFVNARKWYARRVEMGGWDEEVYFAMFRVAESMVELGAPWPDVQDAFLRAWEFRPTRAEPLYAIARRYREEQRYDLGYLFAKRAAEIPFPQMNHYLSAPTSTAGGQSTSRRCAHPGWASIPEAFTLCRRLLARPDVPDEERDRIAGNRDVCVPTMIDAASSYPDALVQRLLAGSGEAEVVVSVVAGRDRTRTEQTLNSFLHCCRDVSRVARFLLIDTGLSAQNRAKLRKQYGFLEFVDPGPADGPEACSRTSVRTSTPRFWLHLGEGWRFFAPDDFITRLTAVLEAEPEVFQVGINFADAVKLTGNSAAEAAVRRPPAPAVTSSPMRRPPARRCSTSHAWIGPLPPGCAPQASTKCCASPQSDFRHNTAISCPR